LLVFRSSGRLASFRRDQPGDSLAESLAIVIERCLITLTADFHLELVVDL
jgi:hypothetical protein